MSSSGPGAGGGTSSAFVGAPGGRGTSTALMMRSFRAFKSVRPDKLVMRSESIKACEFTILKLNDDYAAFRYTQRRKI